MSTHANNKKFLCVRLWKGTRFCRRVLFSSFFFLSFFFSHPESRLRIKIVVGKNDVLGRGRVEARGGKQKRKNEKT